VGGTLGGIAAGDFLPVFRNVLDKEGVTKTGTFCVVEEENGGSVGRGFSANTGEGGGSGGEGN